MLFLSFFIFALTGLQRHKYILATKSHLAKHTLIGSGINFPFLRDKLRDKAPINFITQ